MGTELPPPNVPIDMKHLGAGAFIASFLVAFGGWTAAAAEPITLDLPAAPASRVVQDVAKATGLMLEVSPDLAKEVLLIRVKKMPSETLLARIAEAIGGVWVENEGVKRLQADPQKDREALDAEQKYRVDYLTKLRQERPRAGGHDSPMREVLGLLDPKALAEIAEDHRVVYATSATKMQRPLSQKALTLFRQAEANQPPPPQIHGVATPAAGSEPPGPTVKVFLVVTRPSRWDGIMFSLTGADAQGRRSSFSRVIQYGYSGHTKDAAPYEPSKAGGTMRLSERARLTAFSVTNTRVKEEASEGYHNMNPELFMHREDDPCGPTPTEVRELIASPDRYDPLDSVVGEFLKNLSEAEQANIVACIPDSALIPACKTFAGGRCDVKAAVKASQTDWGITYKNDSAGLLIRPRNPLRARETRLDREVLGRALRTVAEKGLLTLDELANYVCGEPISMPGGFELVYFQLAGAGASVNQLRRGGFEGRLVLKFYGLLGPGHRASLKAGRPLEFRTLTAGQRQALSAFTFDPESNLNYGPQDDLSKVISYEGTNGDGRCLERTQTLGNGLPIDGFIAPESKTADIYFGVDERGAYTPTTPGAGSVSTLGSGQATDPQTLWSNIPRFPKYRAGNRLILRLTFNYLPEVWKAYTLYDYSVDTAAPIVRSDQMPKEFLDWVARSEELLQKHRDRTLGHPPTGD